jgi:hypothetical protein
MVDEVMCLAKEALTTPLFKLTFLTKKPRGFDKCFYFCVDCTNVDVIHVSMVEALNVSSMKHGLTGKVENMVETA